MKLINWNFRSTKYLDYIAEACFYVVIFLYQFKVLTLKLFHKMLHPCFGSQFVFSCSLRNLPSPWARKMFLLFLFAYFLIRLKRKRGLYGFQRYHYHWYLPLSVEGFANQSVKYVVGLCVLEIFWLFWTTSPWFLNNFFNLYILYIIMCYLCFQLSLT